MSEGSSLIVFIFFHSLLTSEHLASVIGRLGMRTFHNPSIVDQSSSLIGLTMEESSQQCQLHVQGKAQLTLLQKCFHSWGGGSSPAKQLKKRKEREKKGEKEGGKERKRKKKREKERKREKKERNQSKNNEKYRKFKRSPIQVLTRATQCLNFTDLWPRVSSYQ